MRGEARETAERVCVWLSASGVWRLASVGSYRGDIFRMYHYIHLELVDDIFLGETRRHPIPSTRGHDTRDAEFVWRGSQETDELELLSPAGRPGARSEDVHDSSLRRIQREQSSSSGLGETPP